MDVTIRQAVGEDASSVLRIAQQLGVRPGADLARLQRGFLIPNPLEQYEHFIAHDDVLIVESKETGSIIGFSIVLWPDTIKLSGLWERTEEVRWEPSFSGNLDPETSTYYEQVAFDPAHARSVSAVCLGFLALWRTFQRYTCLVGTVARYPVFNKSPRPFLEKTGSRIVGAVSADYPGIGRIDYDMYYLDRMTFESKLREPFFVRLMDRTEPFRANLG